RGRVLATSTAPGRQGREREQAGAGEGRAGGAHRRHVMRVTGSAEGRERLVPAPDKGPASSIRRGGAMAERAAIVTGGSGGIGLAIARALGERGYALTLSARRPEKLEAAVAGLREDGFELQTVPANVADEEELVAVFAAHKERYGR